MVECQDLPLAERPKTLDPDEYFKLSQEKRNVEEARVALRANLKQQYLLQLNDPHRRGPIVDPAVTQWVYARAHPYDHFRATPKTSILGFTFGLVPLFVMYYLFKTSRDRREEQIKAGTYKRPFAMSY